MYIVEFNGHGVVHGGTLVDLPNHSNSLRFSLKMSKLHYNGDPPFPLEDGWNVLWFGHVLQWCKLNACITIIECSRVIMGLPFEKCKGTCN
jgi:hypothetical protein